MYGRIVSSPTHSAGPSAHPAAASAQSTCLSGPSSYHQTRRGPSARAAATQNVRRSTQRLEEAPRRAFSTPRRSASAVRMPVETDAAPPNPPRALSPRSCYPKRPPEHPARCFAAPLTSATQRRCPARRTHRCVPPKSPGRRPCPSLRASLEAAKTSQQLSEHQASAPEQRHAALNV